ncbi:MAG: rRNA maturation RNase YbeY [Lachnospiraceae bacterium]|nr:rRNA maturation RNase YbeY [Lachnospiraceae bacterium]
MSRLRLSLNRNGTVEAPFPLRKRAFSVIRAVLLHEGILRDAEVSLYLTDAEEVASLNQTYRQKKKTTDVLSFPAIAAETPEEFLESLREIPEEDPVFLGDIVLNWDRVESQAAEYGHSIEREYSFLIAHSVLHLIGYDHRNKKEEKIMNDIQEEVLTGLHLTRGL